MRVHVREKPERGHERMAVILEDALTLYVFEHPEQGDDLSLMLSGQLYTKDPESLVVRLKAYKSFSAFLEWCWTNKYVTKSEHKLLLKAYQSLINTLYEKMNQDKPLECALGSTARSKRKRRISG
jgi:hypothetical protein